MREPIPRDVRVLVRALLHLYPREFREQFGTAYLEAAEERWRRCGGRFSFVLFMAMDTVRAPSVVWWRSLRTPHRPDPDGRTVKGALNGRGILSWLDSLRWDVRVAGRSLARRPGLCALVVGTLALGIGANVALFGVLDRMILNPFPFEGGDRLAYVQMRDASGWYGFPTQGDFDRWRAEARAFEGMEAIQSNDSRLYARGGNVDVKLQSVSAGLPAMLGLRPVVGRTFLVADAEAGATPVAMLNEDFWRSEFGADPGVVGQTLTIGDEPAVEVIGVWPDQMRLTVDSEPDVYLLRPKGAEIDRGAHNHLLVLLRLDVTRGEAETELRQLRPPQEELTALERTRVPVVRAPHEMLGQRFTRGVWVLFAGVWLLLFAAAANASNLLLNRVVDREGEFGVRLALGAGSRRLFRTVLLESALLVGAGGSLALVLARVGGAVLVAVAPDSLPVIALSGTTTRLLLYILVLMGTTLFVFAAVMATHLGSSRVRQLLTRRCAERRERKLLRSGLIGAQVTLAVALVVGSALAIRSYRELSTTDPGFALREMVTLSVRAPSSRIPSEAERVDLLSRTESVVVAVPGVRGVDASGTSLLSLIITRGEPSLEGDARQPVDDRFSAFSNVEEDFFDVWGIPMLEGRGFTVADREQTPTRAAVVNESFARRYPDGVLGRRGTFREGDTIARQIVGVVGDVNPWSLRDAVAEVQIYAPERLGYQSDSWIRLNLRVDGDPDRVLTMARDRLQALDGDLVVTGATGHDIIRSQTTQERLLALLLMVFGALSLVLAVAGVYGAISLHVSRRTRELGIRIVLGADRRRIVREVVTQELRPILAGMLLGAALAAMLSRYLETLLYQISPLDPVSFAAGAVVLLLSAGAALLVPARRGARIEPLTALNIE